MPPFGVTIDLATHVNILLNNHLHTILYLCIWYIFIYKLLKGRIKEVLDRKIDISKLFPNYAFLNMDSSKLSLKRDKDIIPRALYATTKETFPNDIKVLKAYYSKKEIVAVLKHTKENISNQVCEWVSKRYDVKPFYRYAV